jgi:hypothetical protein
LILKKTETVILQQWLKSLEIQVCFYTHIEIVLDVISKKWTVSRNILLSDMEDSECNP